MKTLYQEYLDLCDKLGIEPSSEQGLWEDHYKEINLSIDYKGYYP